jgi:hypothetical protein
MLDAGMSVSRVDRQGLLERCTQHGRCCDRQSEAIGPLAEGLSVADVELAAANQLIEHRSKAVDIRAHPDLLTVQQLRRAVPWLSRGLV